MKRTYRDTWAEVDLSCIRRNVEAIKRKLPPAVKLMAVVKANGYGHGDAETARAAIRAGADYLAVAYLSEALRLRNQGFEQPMLVLTPIRPEDVPLAVRSGLMLTVASADWFEQARRYKSMRSSHKLAVHVKMDTGLGRIGIREKQDWERLLPWLLEDDVVVDGVYTHFATASQPETTFLRKQAARFEEMKAWVKQSGLAFGRFHCANSAAALRFPELAMDIVRIGAAMYGFYPGRLVPSVDLEPALSLHSRIVQTKKLSKGEFVGYDLAYRTNGEEWIGTVPIGYADGWAQSLRDSDVLVEGQRVSVIGKIGMDQLMIRLPHYVPEGTKVTLIGKQGNERITCAELAGHLDSVPQELSTSLSDRICRIYDKQELRADRFVRASRSSSLSAALSKLGE
ncbi:alanine racemase [Cohnella faecalis]|uniref:Alanine racemase n=1 Tax=Cohnella faecalis TaxID=2315694 RepID=A0A398CN18_9BACL|nr:alanine racemase [Cohnella faecalis]RIE04746.1 alanine racemase [Cohnella faecalis]